MSLPICTGCALPVLELDGQFELLSPFFLYEGGPPRETVGYWHTTCLGESVIGAAWFAAHRRSHVEVRRKVEVATPPGWSVVRDPVSRETVALSHRGQSLSLSFPGPRRPVDGGFVYAVTEREFNLEFADREAMKAIQDGLAASGRFSLLAILDLLGAGDRVDHRQALEGASFIHDAAFTDEWSPTFVCTRAEYGVFVPAGLGPFVTSRP